VTTTATQSPDPEDQARREQISAQLEADFAERKAVRGYDTPLSDETLVLDAIFCVAASHDTLTQYYEDKVYQQMGLHGEPSGRMDDSALNDYLYTAIELCAAIAPAAIRRIPAPVFAKAVARSGEIQALQGQELESFLRPIFEESDLGDRFEVRTFWQAYHEPEATRSN